MTFIWRNALREIRNNRSFSIFYSLNLTLGLIGFVSVDSFRHSIDERIVAESKELLGADLAIRARREITDEELASVRSALPSGTEEIKVVDFFSMAAGPSGRSRLVKIIAFQPGYPYYGSIQTHLNGRVTGEEESLIHQNPQVWIFPELRGLLNVDLGEELKIGESSFRVLDLVEEESGLSFQAAELAPKVFISERFLSRTKLLQRGNTAFRNYLFKLPPGYELDSVAEAVKASLSSPEVRTFSHQRVGHRAGRLLHYLSDFLGIVSMVALFLTILGSAYLYHGFINKRVKEVAILTCLGATKATALKTYLLQLSMLGAASATAAIFICFLAIPMLSGTLSGFTPMNLEATLHPASLPLTFLVAVVSGWLLALPSLTKIIRLRPALLFQEASSPQNSKSKTSWLYALPALLGFWGLCLLQSDSENLANLFFLCLLGSILILFAIGSLGLSVLGRIFRKATLNLRLPIRSLTRNKPSTITGFLALGMGVLLLNLIPQFHYSLEQELGSEANESKLPKLFLFDIQENQLEDLEETLRLSGKPLLNRTPWVRGRLLSVKGINYEDLVEKDRDFQNPGDQRRNRLRNRGFNLSYRERLLESEEILRGRMVRMTFDRSGGEPAEISVEHKYAESLGVDLGDRMEIEVSGVPIEAEVVNLRRVKWTTFQPNFFVQMQPGVLESAPKTFIGTLNDLDPNEKEVIQDLLVRKFPTISILDVERTGRKILEIVSQMTWILQVMAALSVLAGLIVLYSLALEKARRQKWELALLKILGASFSDLKCQIRIEFGLLALTAASLGVSLSLATSYLLAEQVFDRVWSFHLAMPLLSVLTVTLLSLLTAELATGKILKAKPSSLIFENK
ncbi:MAG: hypothetical protein CMI22_06140 [Opitutae bacterium]|nr:hypothetical protein [Opitutae bacterium]